MREARVTNGSRDQATAEPAAAAAAASARTSELVYNACAGATGGRRTERVG